MIALSGCLSGRVCKALEENRPGDARAELDRLAQVFGRDSVYVELQNAHLDVQARSSPALELAATTRLPTVATGDVHYLRHEDARAHEALLCIQSGDSLKNPNHWKFETDHFYFKTPEEMAGDFPGHADALRARSRSRSAATSTSTSTGILLPKFPTPDDRDAFDYLVELCETGLEKRYGTVDAELRDRLRFELKTIKEMGFADYFLIVWDIIHFAKGNGISVGPGRARPPARSSPTASRSPTSTRSATASCSSGSSTRPQAAPRRRHRLRRRRARAGDQLRDGEIRPGSRRPDHHVRDDGRPCRRPRPGRVLEIPYGTVDGSRS